MTYVYKSYEQTVVTLNTAYQREPQGEGFCIAKRTRQGQQG